MTPGKHADPSLLIAFADRAAALPPDAWDRIAERCARLDPSTVEAFLGRVALQSRAVTPELDPYTPAPLVRSTVATIGGVIGVVLEALRLLPSDPEAFERASQPRPDRAPATPDEPFRRAFMKVESLAQRQQTRHAGTASALRAVCFALMAGPAFRSASLDAIYKPFEPEIPFASLLVKDAA